MADPDLSRDYQAFSFQTSMLLTVPSTATASVIGITSSKLTYSQRVTMGSSLSLESRYRNFSLPVINCGGLTVVPGSVLAEASPSNVTWRVMSAELRTVNTRWFCLCIKQV